MHRLVSSSVRGAVRGCSGVRAAGRATYAGSRRAVARCVATSNGTHTPYRHRTHTAATTGAPRQIHSSPWLNGVIESSLDTGSTAYQRNLESTTELMSHIDTLSATYRNGEITEKSKTGRNSLKLFPRERLALLLDEGEPFLELSLLAAHEVYPMPVPAAGVITGIGKVHGQECLIMANDWTVKGGTFFPVTIKKALRAQEIAQENRLPCIYLVDSGGAFLPLQAEIFADRDMGGRSFRNQAIMSAMGIPQIAVAMGHCTAGGAYTPAMSDEVVIVKNTGAIFLGGPPLVKAATGEEVGAMDLGGAEVHCEVSGVADHYAEDEPHSLEIVRELVSNLNLSKPATVKMAPSAPPLYSTAELDGLASSDPQEHPSAHEVIARVVDGSSFAEHKARFGPGLVTGFARIEGIPVGLVASNGEISPAAAQKGAHFVELCDRRGIPLVFLSHTEGTGFGGLQEDEHKGMAKQAAKMMHAVACCRVPKITVVTGGAVGPAYFALGGRPMQPRFMFMWPTAHVAMMGEQEISGLAKGYIEQQAAAALAKGVPENKVAKLKAFGLRQVESQYSALYGSARLWDDGIIAPRDTRKMLALALSAALNAPTEPRSAPGDGNGVTRPSGSGTANEWGSGFGVFRM